MEKVRWLDEREERAWWALQFMQMRLTAELAGEKDWGINWNAALGAGGMLVSEKVALEFAVSAIRTGDAA